MFATLKSIQLKLRRFREMTKAWTRLILKGSHNHFSCYLPKKIGFIASSVFKLFFSGVTVEKDQTDRLQTLPEDAIIIYAGKYKTYFEYLFYHTRYQQNGAKPPEIGFDYQIFLWQPLSRILRIFFAHLDHLCQYFSLPDPYQGGYIREELMNGKAALLSLLEKEGFQRRFVRENPDPIQYLIEMQKEIDRPVYIIPQLIFFSRHPSRAMPTLTDLMFGTEEKPGKIRRMILLFNNPGKVFVEISEPLNLKAFLELPENQNQDSETLSLVLRRRLLMQFNRHRQSITGPIIKSKDELKENILTNDRIRGFMEHYSENRKIPLSKVYKEADEYIDEIAAKYNPSIVQLYSIAVRWLISMMFEGITVNTDTLNKVRTMSQKGPVILIPCHKSHIDYLVLSYVLYHNNMPCPHVAAGKNLSFWPMGPLFRNGGAFFIRRTFRGAVLYSKVFSEYVYKILEEGFNVEFFIEGGRSRTGKLIQPKFGLLSILLNAYREGACEDLIFAPVYVGYDRVLEESSYLYELEGGQKKPENFLQIIKARKFLKKRYGKIYLQFHEPISFNTFLAQYGMSSKDMTSKEHNRLCRHLGYKFLNAIDHETVITPHAVVASAILNCPKQRFSFEYLMTDIEIYMNYLFIQDAKLADTLLIDYSHAIRSAFDAYVSRKFIEPVARNKDDQDFEEQFVVNESRRSSLDYYKNNGITFFIPAAFVALSILEKDAFQFSVSDIHEGYNFFREFFNNEFAYDVERPSEYFVRRNIKAFIDDAILIPHPTLPDSYNLTSAGFRKLKLFSSFLKTYFESYWIVLNVFMRYPRDFIDAKNRMKKTQSMGNRMYKRKEVEHPEALSKINYQNAIDFFIVHGVKGSEDNEKIEFYANKIQMYLKYLSW